MRKLVTIRTIAEVVPIDGADQIEVVKLDGWQCVVKKGKFALGDFNKKNGYTERHGSGS